MVTRYTVALDAGGTLQLVRQNVDSASAEALLEQGKEVLVGWRPEHAAADRRQIDNKRRLHDEEKDAHPARTAWLIVAGLVAFMLVLAGCGGSAAAAARGGGGEELQKLGKGEGAAEPDLLGRLRRTNEWVKPFEAETGCKVNNKEAGTSDEMVEADGDRPVRRRLRLRQRHRAPLGGRRRRRPVNVSLVPNYKTVFADLKNQPYNTFEGVSPTGSRTVAAPTC